MGTPLFYLSGENPFYCFLQPSHTGTDASKPQEWLVLLVCLLSAGICWCPPTSLGKVFIRWNVSTNVQLRPARMFLHAEDALSRVGVVGCSRRFSHCLPAVCYPGSLGGIASAAGRKPPIQSTRIRGATPAEWKGFGYEKSHCFRLSQLAAYIHGPGGLKEGRFAEPH